MGSGEHGKIWEQAVCRLVRLVGLSRLLESGRSGLGQSGRLLRRHSVYPRECTDQGGGEVGVGREKKNFFSSPGKNRLDRGTSLVLSRMHRTLSFTPGR